jgi:murein L,D-transpeptidase YcbB/YkuD
MFDLNKILVVMKKPYIYILLVVFFFACRTKDEQPSAQITPRDYTIDSTTAENPIFFDSLRMEEHLRFHKYDAATLLKFRNFYNGRNYQYAWFSNSGMKEQASAFMNLFYDYINYSKDNTLLLPGLEKQYDSLFNNPSRFSFADSIVFDTEILLTAQFFRYAAKAYTGSAGINARELEWYIPRKKINAVLVLDSLLTNKNKDLSALEPLNHQYKHLKQFLLRYYEIEKAGGWKPIKADKKKYQLNDSSRTITALKEKLFLTGDLTTKDTGSIFTTEMEQAVKHYQKRFGLKEDGIVTSSLITQMNKPVELRLQQILINMERLRWLPAQAQNDILLVNIPEFKLHILSNGKQVRDMNIVVGTVVNNTVIFSAELKHVIFSPYWNIPPGILYKEVLPAIRRNPNYMSKHNMEWYGNTIRQRPGENNPLGLVKFIFPNNFNMYLHDSPAKSLFTQTRRTFSHGCMRVADARWLAQFLLRNQPEWTEDKIDEAMHAGKEKVVNVKDKVTVYVVYLTAFVDSEGHLNFRDDVYGHDKKMAAQLFKSSK